MYSQSFFTATYIPLLHTGFIQIEYVLCDANLSIPYDYACHHRELSSKVDTRFAENTFVVSVCAKDRARLI